ncbi:MAG TPA: threonine--tRNA ligase [Patescibacteria group bacterium]|nr:threonine--tRNA ligase [Patescibacteria group bacterium]
MKTKVHKENKNLEHLRHSASHLLAAAVLKLYPNAKPTIGPAIEEGFYYDFDNIKISDEDLTKIEGEMRKIQPSWKGFVKHLVSANDAKKEHPDNPYKHEMIDEFSENGKMKVSFYKSGNYWDLCKGGHIEHPDKNLKYFKLLSIAGAYWRGSEKNKMLTRIYGTAFFSQKELDDHLKLLDEAKESDHRIIGKKLGLFTFSDLVGKGLPLLTDKGATIRRELERFIVDEEIKRGYKHVITPPLAKTDLYRMSGHYPYYKDTMYPVMKVDDEELILRPMTCPHHFMLFKSDTRSYKDLPIRYAEMASQHRYEKSGELSGLVRVRMFTLNDAHIFIQKEKAIDEIKSVLDLIDYANQTLGLVKGVDYLFRLSLGDRKDNKKYYKDDAQWDEAEAILRKVLVDTKAPYYEADNEAAFYGPKIDVQVKKVNGKEETAFTVQYDFVMPKRFDLKYIDKNGKDVQPIVIHRAAIGCIERTMAFLIEKFKGNFPTWLAPVQVKVLPITDRQLSYAESVVNRLKAENIRTELDDRSETLGAKIRDAQNQKVNYMLIVGDKEVKNKTVTERARSGEVDGPFDLDIFIKNIKKEIEDKVIWKSDLKR